MCVSTNLFSISHAGRSVIMLIVYLLVVSLIFHLCQKILLFRFQCRNDLHLKRIFLLQVAGMQAPIHSAPQTQICCHSMIWTADQNNKHISRTGCLVGILTAEKFNLINIYVTVCRFICFLSIILQYNQATAFFNSSKNFINFSTACCNLQIYQVVQTANCKLCFFSTCNHELL